MSDIEFIPLPRLTPLPHILVIGGNVEKLFFSILVLNLMSSPYHSCRSRLSYRDMGVDLSTPPQYIEQFTQFIYIECFDRLDELE